MRIKGRRESKNIEDQRGLQAVTGPLKRMVVVVPPSIAPKKPLPPAVTKKPVR